MDGALRNGAPLSVRFINAAAYEERNLERASSCRHAPRGAYVG